MAPFIPMTGGNLVDAAGKAAGELTSVSPQVENGLRHALGYVKRGASEVFLIAPDGTRHPVSRVP